MLTFATEDDRKTKLFEAWNNYLHIIHRDFEDAEFEEFYEGLAEVKKIYADSLEVKLEEGGRIQSIPITPEISQFSVQRDTIYFVLGLQDGKWTPLEIVSVVCMLGTDDKTKMRKVHMTVNPLLASHASPQALNQSVYHS